MNFLAALLYAVSSSTLMALLLAFLRGGLNPSVAAISLGFGSLVASFSFWRDRFAVSTSKPPRGWEWGAIVAFTLICLRVFLWLVFQDTTHGELEHGDAIKVLSPNNLGDLSLHLTYIKYLASGVTFWPDNPIFAGGKLTYPVGTDLFNSLLLLVGADPLRALIWCGLAGSALTGAALWRWGRAFALFGFLANGGLAGFALYFTHQLADFQSELAWKSIVLALFATQRGLLYALPAGLALLISWRARLFGSNEKEWRLPRWGEVLLYASMPLFHLHTFLFLSLLLGAWFILYTPASRRAALHIRNVLRRIIAVFHKPLKAPVDPSDGTKGMTDKGDPILQRELLVVVGASLIPASALVLLITGMMKGAHVLGFKAGWMWDDDTFLQWCQAHWGQSSPWLAGLTFWPLNFGLLPVFVVALCVMLLRKKGDPWDRAIVFPALFAFLVCCFVKFAQWDWDNTKIMIWSYLAILPSLWTRLISRWPEWGRAVACFALFWSGFVSTLGGIDQTHRGYEIATRSELIGVAQAVEAIPVSERFVGYPTYNHPLLLCGRKMAMGYIGHVVSHGLAWEVPAAEVNRLMNGDELLPNGKEDTETNWRECAINLHARYLFWGRPERDCEEYRESSQPWKKSCKLVASGPWGDIYDLQTPAAPK